MWPGTFRDVLWYFILFELETGQKNLILNWSVTGRDRQNNDGCKEMSLNKRKYELN